MTSPQIRRRLQQVLGVLWLLDGALQLQPALFGPGFAHQVIVPAAQGQPSVVADSVRWAAHLILTAPAAWNAAFAAAQLAIGALLLSRRTVRVGLAASVGWAAGVWWFGEGAGQVAGGQADLLTGAPGAVLLYLLVAVCVWPPGGRWLPLPVLGVRALWLSVWASGALLRLLPGARGGGALRQVFTAAASGAPPWLAGFDHALAHAVAGTGATVAAGLAVGYLLIGGSAFGPQPLRVAGLAGGVAAATFIWVAGESFGGIASGYATDPNTGPLLVLLAAAVAARGGLEVDRGGHRRRGARDRDVRDAGGGRVARAARPAQRDDGRVVA